MVDRDKKIEKLEFEIENLEKRFEQSHRESLFDRSAQDRLYRQLKKKRKELAQLKGVKKS